MDFVLAHAIEASGLLLGGVLLGTVTALSTVTNSAADSDALQLQFGEALDKAKSQNCLILAPKLTSYDDLRLKLNAIGIPAELFPPFALKINLNAFLRDEVAAERKLFESLFSARLVLMPSNQMGYFFLCVAELNDSLQSIIVQHFKHFISLRGKSTSLVSPEKPSASALVVTSESSSPGNAIKNVEDSPITVPVTATKGRKRKIATKADDVNDEEPSAPDTVDSVPASAVKSSLKRPRKTNGSVTPAATPASRRRQSVDVLSDDESHASSSVAAGRAPRRRKAAV
jgi:hypothetical protein